MAQPWNPVKELKGHPELFNYLNFQGVPWNPVKELKELRT